MWCLWSVLKWQSTWPAFLWWWNDSRTMPWCCSNNTTVVNEQKFQGVYFHFTPASQYCLCIWKFAGQSVTQDKGNLCVCDFSRDNECWDHWSVWRLRTGFCHSLYIATPILLNVGNETRFELDPIFVTVLPLHLSRENCGNCVFLNWFK